VPSSDVRIQLPERYRVVRHVANGGMASVWSAEDSVLGRLVAVKILAQHVAADPSARTRFEREARTAARVSDHPNVATIYDVGEHENVPFIVMELFTGGTVGDRLRGGQSVAGGIPRRRALAWLEQASGALDYAHAEGIVHRDIKPANLLLDERDRLAVGDFGIARAAEDSNLTQAGQVLGTAAYLSPEQALGHPATAASDRYSMAVVAYELLCGRRPFQGDHIAAQARQHIEGEVPDSGLGSELDDVLRRGMAKAPDDRYPTASRFVEELEAVAGRAAAPPTQATRRVASAAPPPPLDPTPTPAAAVAAAPRRREATPPPAPPRPADARKASGGGPNRPVLALAGVLAVALVIAAVALLGGGGGEGQRADAPAQTSTAAERGETSQAQPAADPPAEAPAPAQTTPPAAEETTPDNEPEDGPGPTSEGNESPSQLDARGFRLLQQGSAAEAVPLLEQAVAGFESQGDGADATGYGFALYNLGTAYAQTGRPAEAIPLFERRLQVSPDDRPGIVRKALKDARKAAGDAD
jgi:serine/threonine-protein kinase